MASLLAARRQDFAAAYGLHARAESVRLRAASLPRLKCALWQSTPPLDARSQGVFAGAGSSCEHKAAVGPRERQVSNLQV